MPDPERARDLALRRVYGITLAEYRSILAAQGGRCPVCRKALSGWSNPVDHDHKTGIIRGITCMYCNHRVIGRHRDWELVYRAAMYLKDNPARRVIGSRTVPPKKPRKRSSVPARAKPAAQRAAPVQPGGL